jgi:hypothetical protein
MYIIIITEAEDAVIKYEFGVFGIIFINILFIVSDILLNPMPEYSSNHPWSTDFIR